MGAKSLLIGLLIFGLVVSAIYTVQAEFMSNYGVSGLEDYSSFSRINQTMDKLDEISAPVKGDTPANPLYGIWYYITASWTMFKLVLEIPDIMSDMLSDVAISLEMPILIKAFDVLIGIFIIIIIFEIYYIMQGVKSE